MIEDVGIFKLDRASYYDPEEIDMMIDVLYRLDFIVQKDKGFTISDKGKNVLNYFKGDYGSNKITVRA